MATNGDGPLDKPKEDERHPTHSIEWSWSGGRPTTITCNRAGTVEALLGRSSQFRAAAAAAGKRRGLKELVIVRDGRAISSHFPCSLIRNERLTVKCVKAVEKPQKAAGVSARPLREAASRELLMFHVSVKGGKNVVRIMRNSALKSKVQEVTVYAFRGEKVKHALRRDGRFLNTIFKKTCALCNVSSEVSTEMSNLVDGLDGKTFQIILLNKSSPPESQPSLSEDLGESQRSEAAETSSSVQPENQDTPTGEPQRTDDTAPILHQLPGSQAMQSRLSSQFREFLKTLKTPVLKLSRIQNLFRAEYGQKAQMCREVRTMKTLMELSDSVCHVRINGSPRGTGFLLFGHFVLTNGHVVRDVFHEDERRLGASVTVHFSFESLAEAEAGRVEVEEVVGFEYRPEVSGGDWAVLRLRAGGTLPGGLLDRSGLIPRGGGICIIGHPDGGVKKIDPCLIVSPENQAQVVEQHYHENQAQVQLLTARFFEGVAQAVQQDTQVLTYESCFYFGSSGSPVFDQHCRVVAVHSGGYAYRGTGGETRSVIEFGYPLSTIVQRFVVQTVETERFDLLKEFAACGWAQRQTVMAAVKELIQSRNVERLKNVVNNAVSSSVGEDHEGWGALFDLVQKDDAVPMEIN